MFVPFPLTVSDQNEKTKTENQVSIVCPLWKPLTAFKLAETMYFNHSDQLSAHSSRVETLLTW